MRKLLYLKLFIALEKVLLALLRLTNSKSDIITHDSNEFLEKKNGMALLGHDSTRPYDVAVIGDIYQSSSCWRDVFNDLSQMKHPGKSGLLDSSELDVQEIDSCYFFSREHRRYLALQVTNCHMRESGRQPVSDFCSSSIVLKENAKTEKSATCLSKLEWQTYTHFYLSIETICAQLQKEYVTRKLFELSRQHFQSEKSFGDGISTALSNLETLRTSQLERDLRIKKERENQVLAEEKLKLSVESFFGGLWINYPCYVARLGSLYQAQQLDFISRTACSIIGYAYLSFTCGSLECASWRTTLSKFGFVIVILVTVTTSRLTRRSRRKLIQLALGQMLTELFLLSTLTFSEHGSIYSFLWRWTNKVWLFLSCCFYSLTAMITATGQKAAPAMTAESNSKSTKDNMERIIEFQRLENDRMLYTMVHFLTSPKLSSTQSYN